MHTQGLEVGGQRHKVILERDDGFVKAGSSVSVDTTPLEAALALIAELQATIATIEASVTDLDTRVTALEPP